MWLVAVVLALGLLAPSQADNKIKNVVVLMEENRAFDHMLGWLKKTRPEVDGLTGDEYNLANPRDPNSHKYFVTADAEYVDANDPDHSYGGTFDEVFGGNTWVGPPAPMAGFAMTNGRIGEPGMVMRGFPSERVPIITTLANEFALFDRWFASVPGPTNPNRRFLHAATADGSLDDADYNERGFTATTVFDVLLAKNISWGIFFEDWSPSCMFASLRTAASRARFHPMSDFYAMAGNGTLPQYAFIEPRMFPTKTVPANDQHPDHDVRDGERLMRDVYLAVRHSPQWNHTLLLITYDEHGGYYDHVPTPLVCPNPDGKNATEFNFTRIGIRVPTIAISPWIDKGVLVHDAPAAQRPTPTSEYEHSSVPATLGKLFGFAPLTKRAEWASTFEHVWSRDSLRTDCPDTLPDVPQSFTDPSVFASRPLNDLQRSFLTQVNSCYPTATLSNPATRAALVSRIEGMTQAVAGAHLKALFEAFLAE
eukprot:m.230720 g.230720  ORF g.230720 m.230720 type:complete len:480 (-) comp18134_c0_seq1:32-1471(-)